MDKKIRKIDHEIEMAREMPLRDKCDECFREGVLHGLRKARFIIVKELGE